MAVMTTADDSTATPGMYVPTADQRVVMHGIGWAGYQSLLALRGETGSRPKLAYLDGAVELMTPSHGHERTTCSAQGGRANRGLALVHADFEHIPLNPLALDELVVGHEEEDGIRGAPTRNTVHRLEIRAQKILPHDSPRLPTVTAGGRTSAR